MCVCGWVVVGWLGGWVVGWVSGRRRGSSLDAAVLAVHDGGVGGNVSSLCLLH